MPRRSSAGICPTNTTRSSSVSHLLFVLVERYLFLTDLKRKQFACCWFIHVVVVVV